MIEPVAALDQVRATAIDLGLKFGPKLFVALVTLALGHYVARWAARTISRLLTRFSFEPPVRALVTRGAHLLVFGLFVILALQNLGVELLPLIAGLGVAGAGVAIAMQGVLGNVVAGLTIIFSRPFRVGEYITIVGVEGTVETIGLFSTVLSHPDRSQVVVPNRKIVGEILHNYGSVRQLHVTVDIAQDADVAVALAAVDALLASTSCVRREPAPIVLVERLGDAATRIAVRPWVEARELDAAASAVNRGVLETFRAHGIAMARPRYDVHLLGGEGRAPVQGDAQTT